MFAGEPDHNAATRVFPVDHLPPVGLTDPDLDVLVKPFERVRAQFFRLEQKSKSFVHDLARAAVCAGLDHFRDPASRSGVSDTSIRVPPSTARNLH